MDVYKLFFSPLRYSVTKGRRRNEGKLMITEKQHAGSRSPQDSRRQGVLVAGMEVRRRSSGEDLALLPVDLPAVGLVPFC